MKSADRPATRSQSEQGARAGRDWARCNWERPGKLGPEGGERRADRQRHRSGRARGLGAQLKLLQLVPEDPPPGIAGEPVIRGEQTQQLPAERIRKKGRHQSIPMQYRNMPIAAYALSLSINR